ncbi:MAG TPA: G/U mismatch-specific DNA glycosylase [Candidatus Eisenbacteria bacterium]|nr:G/U mismatch-specific DNA glycosylase [Candidatus Eisenbacteria bacterium]
MKRPTEDELRNAAGKAIPDAIGPDVRVLFVAINPGLYSGATGFHFARPGNRFWPTLHGAGFTPRQLAPDETDALRDLGIGITNLVNRTTATAAELDDDELRQGAVRLRETVDRYRPRAVAVLGVDAFRRAFEQPKAIIGPQADPLGSSELWVLPNPSGLNAHYQLPQLIELFAAFRTAVADEAAVRRLGEG